MIQADIEASKRAISEHTGQISELEKLLDESFDVSHFMVAPLAGEICVPGQWRTYHLFIYLSIYS